MLDAGKRNASKKFGISTGSQICPRLVAFRMPKDRKYVFEFHHYCLPNFASAAQTPMQPIIQVRRKHPVSALNSVEKPSTLVVPESWKYNLDCPAYNVGGCIVGI